MIREIAGRQNHSIKLARKLQKKKHRRERGLFVAEGLDLLEIAVDAGADVREVLVRSDLFGQVPGSLVERAEAGSIEIGICSEELLALAGSLGGAADVVFMGGLPGRSLGDLDLEGGIMPFLQEVGDPGNVGTLVRSAVAFGAAGLICSPGTADPYGPKAMRAGMGAQFLMPVVTEVTAPDLVTHLSRLEGRGGPPARVLVADAWKGEDCATIEAAPRGITLLVLGAERRGPGDHWAEHRRVSIPQERFDSLNVAMAGTILLYVLSRGRGNQITGPLGL